MTTQLRIVALSSGTHDSRIHKVSYRSSASLLDYDVVLWEPERVLTEYLNAYYASSFRGLHSLSEDGSFDLARAVARRRAEMVSFLDLGRTFVIVVPEALRWYVDTGQRTTSGTGRNQKVTHHVSEMTVESLLPFQVSLDEAQGDEMELKLGEPFASFWRAQRNRLYYSAVMSKHPGSVAATVKDTDKPVAAITTVGKGSVILVPTIWWPDVREDDEQDEDDGTVTRTERRAMDEELTDSLLQLAAELRAETGEFAMPDWAAGLHLPGEADKRAEMHELQDQLSHVQEALDDRLADMRRLQERKILFTGSGAALENVAEAALTALGLEVELGAPGRTDRVIRLSNAPAIAEIKGKVKSAAEKDAAQLEKWVASYHAEHDVQPKGILLINAWRDLTLADRESKDAFPEQMLGYSTGRGHCLITGVQLLCAWIDAERNPERVEEIARSIVDTVGVYEPYANWRDYLSEEQTAVED